jgi:hypothetical protein
MMIYEATVVHTIRISVDETKFDEQFMEEFRASFYHFHTLVDHVEHIAQLQSRGIIQLDFNPHEFIEGYGPASEMGIKFIREDVEVEDCHIAPESGI